MSAQTPPPVPVGVEEIGRRIRWPLLPALVFLGIMAALGIVAVIAIRSDPPILFGLPDDPDVLAAAALLRGRVPAVATGGLRFGSSLLDEEVQGAFGGEAEVAGRAVLATPGGADARRLATADSLLVCALGRHRGEPRIRAARAAVALMRDDLGRAERAYRPIVDGKPGYGEARLGLGVTLATRAARATDELETRRLDLQAIAQFAAVRSRDPAYAAALQNRVALLEKVGRGEEARVLKEAR